MDPRNDKDNGLALTESASLYLEQRPRRRRRTRHDSCPILLLLAILSHLVFCGAAIAVSVLVVCYSLQETDETVLGLVARILFFVASCVGVVYVFMHVCAARETFVRSQGTSHLYGRFTVTVAILIMRLGLPLWASAVGTTAVVAKQKGLDLRLGIKGNFIWIQLAAAVLGLLSLLVIVIVVETTDRPFATAVISRRMFIKGLKELPSRPATVDLSVSRQGRRVETQDEKTGEIITTVKHLGFDRSTVNTPESPEIPRVFANEQLRLAARSMSPLRRNPPTRAERTRSQPVPSPLDTVFTLPDSPSADTHTRGHDMPDDDSSFAWRPPTRDSSRHRESQQQETRMSRRPLRASSYYEEPPVLSPPPVPRASRRRSADMASFSVMSSGLNEDPYARRSMISTVYSSGIPAMSQAPESPPPPPPQQTTTDMPSLATLLGALSERAAARRRNSLLVRPVDLEPRRSIDLFQRPAAPGDTQESEFVEIPYPDKSPRSFSPPPHEDAFMSLVIEELSEEHDRKQAVEEEEEEEEQNPRVARSLRRSATFDQATPSVRNFSRPRRRLSSRRISSVDTSIMARGRHPWRNTPSSSSTRRQQQQQQQQVIIPQHSRSASNDKNGKRAQAIAQAPIPTPRFSPFPRVPQEEELSKKVRGLGQGSPMRLELMVAQWRNGVEEPSESDGGEQQQRRRESVVWSSRSSSIVRGQSNNGGGEAGLSRESSQSSSLGGGGGGRRTGSLRRQRSGKLSRGPSTAHRREMMSQNF